MTITTPTVRGATRRWAFWIVAAVILLLIAVGTVLFTGATGIAGDPLSATNAAPAGSKALVEVLRQQGVTVTATDSLAATEEAITDPDDTTLFLFDPNGRLDPQQYNRVKDLGRQHRADESGVPGAGRPDARGGAGRHGSGCAAHGGLRGAGGDAGPSRSPAAAAGTGSPRPNGRRGACAARMRCSRWSGSRTAPGRSPCSAPRTHSRTSIFPSAATRRWPSACSASTRTWSGTCPACRISPAGPPSAELTPQWVPGVMILLLLVFLAAAFWRGRRLGPLVVENLPVVVRASETMEGRARLYQKSSARLHALDALRIGAIQRLATHCGLSRLAEVDEVVAAAAALTGTDRIRVRDLLVDAVPASDRELVRLSDDLLELERAARAASGRPAHEKKSAQTQGE